MPGRWAIGPRLADGADAGGGAGLEFRVVALAAAVAVIAVDAGHVVIVKERRATGDACFMIFGGMPFGQERPSADGAEITVCFERPRIEAVDADALGTLSTGSEPVVTLSAPLAIIRHDHPSSGPMSARVPITAPASSSKAKRSSSTASRTRSSATHPGQRPSSDRQHGPSMSPHVSPPQRTSTGAR